MQLIALAFDAPHAIDAYLNAVSGAIRDRSDAYDEGEAIWSVVTFLVSLAVTFGLYQTGFIRGLRDRVEARLPRWAAVFPFVLVYTLVFGLITLPLDIWLSHFREVAYGNSTQTFGAWFGEYLIEFGLNLVATAIFVGLLYLVIRALKRTWWIWGAGLSAVLIAVMLLILPVFIAPLLNTYTPMEEGPLRTDILNLATAAGVPADDVYVYDRSRQTNTISANVSGILGTTRVSLGDTLLADATPAEVRAVMAHEIGHYVLNHIYEMLFAFTVLIAIGFAFANGTFAWAARTFGGKWGIGDIGDIAGMPLLFALISTFFFFATPVVNTIIRSNETEADAYGLALAREPDGFAAVSMKLGAYRKIDPGPVERFVFHDHPTGRDRVTMSMNFKAAELAAGATDLDPSQAPLVPEVERYVAEREAKRTGGGK
ncbi:M48 family metallopeptidase [Hyphomonas johnsonii]|uniref:Ste24 endopeptidase n=1 Tax=Hyphomonas johnsonii MHS-2 TaxID=1280950 RepID=A0A059FQK3_9PROT|nr:M48 family metallopeptidase [Hyphomonas johnsonii]KCZ92738.1 Ste24 endopeptidase [Hyphomonas johnsonii MHS-2]